MWSKKPVVYKQTIVYEFVYEFYKYLKTRRSNLSSCHRIELRYEYVVDRN